MPADEVNLYARHEAYLLAHASASQPEVPACVISGFLGSGKTTLVSHLLRNRGGLRMAVLINEVGQVDIDSQLVGTGSLHAEVGLLPILHTHDISNQGRSHTSDQAGSHMSDKPHGDSQGLAASSSLAGGCVCCTAAGGLEAALRALRQMGPGQGIEYLVVETSGVADPEPLAEVMARHGFRLESVVAVVDAEAGPKTLEQPVAQSQVRCADVVVVNKCDVASLVTAADVEDAIQQLSPGIRMLRARYGQVPVQAVLDVEETPDVVAAPSKQDHVQGEVGFLSHEAVITAPGPRFRPAGRLSKLARAHQQQVQQLITPHSRHAHDGGHSKHHSQHAQQGVSHKQPPQLISPPLEHSQHDGGHVKAQTTQNSPQESTNCSGHGNGQHGTHGHHHTTAATATGTGQGTESEVTAGSRAAPGAVSETAGSHHHPHASLHEGYHTVSAVVEQPLDLATVQVFAAVLTRLPGVFRSKGILWFQQLRRHRCIFHLSGRQRIECVVSEPWSSPPNSHMVIIGDDATLLAQLRDAFLHLTGVTTAAGGNTSLHLAAAGQQAEGGAHSLGSTIAAGEDAFLQSAAASQRSDTCVSGPMTVSGVKAPSTDVAERIAAQLNSMHERLSCLLISAQSMTSGRQATAHAGGTERLTNHQMVTAGSMVSVSVQGEPLHGVRGSEVNAAIMRRAAASMASTGHLVIGVPEAASISAVSGLSTCGDRMQQLLLLPDASNPLLQVSVLQKLQTGSKLQNSIQGIAATAVAAGTGAAAAAAAAAAGAGAGAGAAANDVMSILNTYVDKGVANMQGGMWQGPQLSNQAGASSPLTQAASKVDSQQTGGKSGCAAAEAAAEEQLTACLWQSAAPALRKAFPHAGCRCDVIGLMHAPE